MVGTTTGEADFRRRPVTVEKVLALSAIALGVTSIVTQVILLREFLSAFYGNELVIGVLLASWMLLTAAGSFLGRSPLILRSGMNAVSVSFLLLAVLPCAMVVALRVLRNVVFPVGTMIGILQILYSSFILLTPYCLLQGVLFTFIAHTISEDSKSNLLTRVYSLEAVGSIIGGVVFNLIMIFFLTTFQALIALMAFNCAVSFALSWKYGNVVKRVAVVCFAVALLAVSSFLDLDTMTKALWFQGQTLLYHKDTPYGTLTVTQQVDQKNFYENNVLLFSTDDVVLNEETVHYAMIQHPDPKYVIVISGGISGTLREVLKYDVARVDYVEINPWIIEVGRRYASAFTSEKVRVIVEDARLYVKETPERYDVALINVPEPGTAQLNRFYTVEFLRGLKTKLNEGAVVLLSLTSSADYLSSEAREVRSVMRNTLSAMFANVLIVPGTKDNFLASDSTLDIHIARMIAQKGIATTYVNQYYLDDELLRQRSDYIVGTLSTKAALNMDFIPVSYYRQMLYWLSQFEVNYWVLLAACIGVFAFVSRRLNAISYGIFSGGFAASSIEVLLLISFQILYGYVYQLTGIIITIFMAGLAAGSFYREKLLPRADIHTYIQIQLGVGLYAVALPLIVSLLAAGATHYLLVHSAFFLLAFIIAVLVGAEFSIAAAVRKGEVSSVASELYGVDLVGSAIGALVVAAYLIPLLGIVKVCFVVSLLSFLGAIVSLLQRKKYLPSVA